MRRTTKYLFAPVLLCLGLSSCDDKPPPGLIDAVERALAGRLLGCPEARCTGVREINISTADTSDQLAAKANDLTKGWCPQYTFTSEKISKNSSGQFSKQSQYSVSIVGFGEVSVSSEDYAAEVKAKEDGWKTQINHTHQAGTGTCPEDWPFRQCKVQPAIEIKADGEVTISWIAGTETKTATAKGSKVINFSPATAIDWCEKNTHAQPLTCTGAAVEDPATSISCTSSADCAQLMCGEWFCQAGKCTQAEKAPDGTACDDGKGTCKNGKCEANPR